MEDDLKKNENGRRPPFCFEKLESRPQKKRKTTSNKNGRQPQKKWKTTSKKICKTTSKKLKVEHDLKKNGR
jgi:hypothetical protein